MPRPAAVRPREADARMRLFGDRVRALRRSRRLTIGKLAALTEIDKSYLGEIERGRRNPTILYLLRIADALEVRPGVLLDPFVPQGKKE